MELDVFTGHASLVHENIQVNLFCFQGRLFPGKVSGAAGAVLFCRPLRGNLCKSLWVGAGCMSYQVGGIFFLEMV